MNNLSGVVSCGHGVRPAFDFKCTAEKNIIDTIKCGKNTKLDATFSIMQFGSNSGIGNLKMTTTSHALLMISVHGVIESTTVVVYPITTKEKEIQDIKEERYYCYDCYEDIAFEDADIQVTEDDLKQYYFNEKYISTMFSELEKAVTLTDLYNIRNLWEKGLYEGQLIGITNSRGEKFKAIIDNANHFMRMKKNGDLYKKRQYLYSGYLTSLDEKEINSEYLA